LESIITQGLTRRDVPLGLRRGETAVWLMSNPDPEAQDWTLRGRYIMSEQDRRLHQSLFGEPVPPGGYYPDKRAVALAVERAVSSSC
jgi:hypothetical protein